MPNGKLLVLDGLDGSGKSTQFELLQTALQKQGVSIQAVSFPDYDSPSAALVKMYLNGELSNTPDGVNAYAASSFYAVDRYANYHLHWEQAYHNGTCILASRYTTSNAIYQMGKLPKSEWDNYLQWLAEYEYGRLELPEPDTVIYLDMPVSVQHCSSNATAAMPERKICTKQTLPFSCSASRRLITQRRSWAGKCCHAARTANRCP